jgi:hypothetical protein
MKKIPAHRADTLLYAILFALVSAGLTAQSAPNQAAVINPKPGVWANKQTLALDVPAGCDVFYSIEGSNPLESGFAYDGPVVIDAEGDVMLRLATVAADNSSVEQTVRYSVSVSDAPASIAAYARGAVFRLNSGTKIELPDNFKYCLGSETEPKFNGRTLSLSAFYPTRLVPCTVSDGEQRWRFVISIEVPRGNRTDSAAPSAEPSRDTDTDTAAMPKFDLVLDGGRYAFKAYFSEDRTARDEGYMFTAPEAGITDPVFEIPVDALFGEEISSSVAINAYYHGVFQGVIQVPYMLDRRPPDTPVIESEASLFGRGPVSLTISHGTSENDGHDAVFYAVESFAPDDSVFENRSLDAKNFSSQPKQTTVFSLLQDSEISLNADFESNSAGAVVYAVFAYAEDISGNKSDYAVFHVLIDTVNYYLAPATDEASEGIPDGSITNPFTSFDHAFNVITRINGARLHIQGDWTVQKSVELSSSCSIFGNGKTRIKFTDDAQLVVKNTSFSAQSIVFEKNSPLDSPYIAPVVSLDGATARFRSCTFAVSAEGNKSLFSSAKSALDFDTCLFSVTASGYGIVVSGNNSEVSVRDSMIVLSASTAVGFSLEDSTFTLSNSRVRMIASLSRVAELARSTFRITGNVFTIDSDTPVWYDRASVPAAYINNRISNE